MHVMRPLRPARFDYLVVSKVHFEVFCSIFGIKTENVSCTTVSVSSANSILHFISHS